MTASLKIRRWWIPNTVNILALSSNHFREITSCIQRGLTIQFPLLGLYMSLAQHQTLFYCQKRIATRPVQYIYTADKNPEPTNPWSSCGFIRHSSVVVKTQPGHTFYKILPIPCMKSFHSNLLKMAKTVIAQT